MTNPKGPMTWEAFLERLKTIYLPSFAPEARVMSRPVAPDSPAAKEPPVPDDIWLAALVVFPDPEAWLHNPVPQLGSKTPLQVLERKQPDQVRQLIMGVADFFLPDPSEVVPWETMLAQAEAEAEAEAQAAAEAAQQAAADLEKAGESPSEG